jgi:hypothetical protein
MKNQNIENLIAPWSNIPLSDLEPTRAPSSNIQLHGKNLFYSLVVLCVPILWLPVFVGFVFWLVNRWLSGKPASIADIASNYYHAPPPITVISDAQKALTINNGMELERQCRAKIARLTAGSENSSHSVVYNNDALFFGTLTECREYLPIAVMEKQTSGYIPRKGPFPDSIVLSTTRGWHGSSANSEMIAILPTRPYEIDSIDQAILNAAIAMQA